MLAVLLLALVALAAVAWWARAPPRPPARDGRVLPGGAVVVWSPAYKVSFFGLERLHPFEADKGARIAEQLLHARALEPDDFAVPGELDPALLARVHDPAYLDELRDPVILSEALELSLPAFMTEASLERRVLSAFRLQVQGTVVAARAARDHGLGINLGGGFHHARPSMGHGFCVYNDVAVAIQALRDAGFAGRVLVIDTDAHQGDGTHAFFAGTADVVTMSLHQGDIFPSPKLRGDLDLALPAGTGDKGVLDALERMLSQAPSDVRFVVHVAGSDVLADDPLTGLSMSPEGLVRRDLQVLAWARARDLPLLHLLAGGYGPSSATAHAASIAAMLSEVRKPVFLRGEE